MSQAQVESIDAIKRFRSALFKFAESANIALGDAESELNRVMLWLETEQLSHWQGLVRKRTEAVTKAKDALRFKKVFKNAVGGKDSTIDEEKALAVASRLLEEAEQKLASTRMWARRMPREIQVYKGNVQRFATTVQSDLPVAAAKLDRMVTSLEAYVSYLAPATDAPGAAAGSADYRQPPPPQEAVVVETVAATEAGGEAPPPAETGAAPSSG